MAFQTFQRVAVFGSADVNQDHPLYQSAFRIASALAQEGVQVVNGGGPGVMKAATDGAQSVGGKTLTVSFHPVNAPFFEGKDNQNHADEDVVAGNYPERVGMLIDHSDAFVIVQGGTGTLSEWAVVWLMAHIYYGNHKPFVLVGDFWHEVIEVISRTFFIDEAENKVFTIVSSESEVVPALRQLENDLLALRASQQQQ